MKYSAIYFIKSASFEIKLIVVNRPWTVYGIDGWGCDIAGGFQYPYTFGTKKIFADISNEKRTHYKYGRSKWPVWAWGKMTCQRAKLIGNRPLTGLHFKPWSWISRTLCSAVKISSLILVSDWLSSCFSAFMNLNRLVKALFWRHKGLQKCS